MIASMIGPNPIRAELPLISEEMTRPYEIFALVGIPTSSPDKSDNRTLNQPQHMQCLQHVRNRLPRGRVDPHPPTMKNSEDRRHKPMLRLG